jgi:hypothetical protein
MFCYGLGNLVNDAWLEQVVKRGWSSWEVPGVTVPRLDGGWAVVVAPALVLWLVWRHSQPTDGSPARGASARS